MFIEIILIEILIGILIGILLGIYILIRNDWVYKKRIKLIKFENGSLLIDQYVSYNTMICRFWIWDIKKFKISSN